MLVVTFLQWWYGPGWRDTANRMTARLESTYLNFSLPVLLKTLFAPWRRITSPPGSTMQDKFKGAIDNTISRAVGFFMRLAVLITALLILALTLLIGCLLLVLWPLIPALGPILIVVGFL